MKIKEAFNLTKQKLLKAGVDDPAFDAIYLFEHVLSIKRTDITVLSEKDICDEKLAILNECIKRRISGEPVQYILGYWYFMGNKYYVADGVLIPRDDTEVLTRKCIELLSSNNCDNVVDLCSGSGIIAITLKKHFQNSTVFAVEKSDIAYKYLIRNCEQNDAEIKTIHSDLYDCVNEFEDSSLDLIVSNPPYIITDELSCLQKEVQFEPKLALDGGEDGYDFYRGIISTWSKKLKTGGFIAFEIGEGQFDYIFKLLQKAHFSDIQGHLDLSSTIRAVTAVYTPDL